MDFVKAQEQHTVVFGSDEGWISVQNPAWVSERFSNKTIRVCTQGIDMDFDENGQPLFNYLAE